MARTIKQATADPCMVSSHILALKLIVSGRQEISFHYEGLTFERNSREKFITRLSYALFDTTHHCGERIRDRLSKKL